MLIKQLIPQEFCLNCRGCCRFSQPHSIWSPHLLREEEAKLGEVLIVANPGGDDFVCNHLGLADNVCGIYARRPFECQLYPYLLNRRNNGFFLALDLNCPYASQNRDSPHLQEYSRKLSGLLETADYLKILRNNPQLFQEYEGVLDINELKI